MIQNGLLGRFLEPILSIAKSIRDKHKANDWHETPPEESILERSAILALCKFMCVSEVLCKEHLDLIFELLDMAIDSEVKSNIIISIGDMFNRFTNSFDLKTNAIYKLLHDEQSHVRR